MSKILTFGEPLMAFHIPPLNNVVLSGGSNTNMSLGGSEINTAIALHRLGHEVTLLTVLPNNELGQYYKDVLKEIGISTKYVLLSNGSMGNMFIKDNKVCYDRKHSAFYNMTNMLFPLDDIFKESFDWIHLTGITPSLSNHNLNVWKSILEQGLKKNIRISFDFNHRPSLIDFSDLWKIVKPYVPFLTVIFLAKEDIKHILSIEKIQSTHSMIQSLNIKQLIYCVKKQMDKYQLRSSILINSTSSIKSIAKTQVVTEPIGGGDAYDAAYIHSVLTMKLSIKQTLNYCDNITIETQKYMGHFSPMNHSTKDTS